MKQIDWIEELQKKIKEEKREFDKQPWWKKREKRPLKIQDFNCDHCMRKIIVQFRHKPGHKEKLICDCGRDFIINAEVTEKWVKNKVGF